MIYTIATTLGSAVAKDGTFNVPYPSGTQAGTFAGGYAHVLYALMSKFSAPTGITVSFGASYITVTYKGNTTIPAGTSVVIGFDAFGATDNTFRPGSSVNTTTAILTFLDLGAPATLDADGIAEAQSASGAHDLTLNGALASNGVVTLDVPRNVIVDSGGADTAVLTVYGTDVYGKALRESITLNGTSAVSGKKAFKTITRIASSATIANGAFVGTGDVLGLPVFLPGAGFVIKELQDGAAATAGTLAAGNTSAATATTGDVRGTYDPNAACDGSKVFKLLVALEDPSYQGLPQYAG